jgi:hypothetical protein
MTSKKVIFQLDDKEYLELDSLCNECQYYRHDEARISFCTVSGSSIIIAYDTLITVIEDFNALLTKTIEGKLPLHESINQDIGYLWNKELHGAKGLTYNIIDNVKYWE